MGLAHKGERWGLVEVGYEVDSLKVLDPSLEGETLQNGSGLAVECKD